MICSTCKAELGEASFCTRCTRPNGPRFVPKRTRLLPSPPVIEVRELPKRSRRSLEIIPESPTNQEEP